MASTMKVRRARKTHPCYMQPWCTGDGSIKPGSLYEHYVVFPGDEVNQGTVPAVFKRCQVCAGAINYS